MLFQATASEVQNLLVSGRKREALQFAQEGQLWGPALVLASQLGDQVCSFQSIQMLAFVKLGVSGCILNSHLLTFSSLFLLFLFSSGWGCWLVPMQFYVDTVKQMALQQLVAGSPLRTLCLLIAGQPAEVFSSYTTTDPGLPGVVNLHQQPAQVTYQFKNCLL